ESCALPSAPRRPPRSSRVRRAGAQDRAAAADPRGRGGMRPVKVDVAIATYRRPRGLFRLLGGLARLRFRGEPPDLRVVVIDHDPAGPAAEVCQDARRWLDLPLVHRVEPRRGIPQARNAAVAAALERAEFVAFIDDDEVPSPQWLDELLRVQAETGADAVAG